MREFECMYVVSVSECVRLTCVVYIYTHAHTHTHTLCHVTSCNVTWRVCTTRTYDAMLQYHG